MPVCPYCGEELNWEDYYGRILSHQDGVVLGDIYQCKNENCEMFQEIYHTMRAEGDELYQGYPC